MDNYSHSYRKSSVRRGTSIAAAALSFALVAPLAQPVAFAQENPAVIADAQDNQPGAPASADEKAIYSPGEASQASTISGSVKEIVEAGSLNGNGFAKTQASGHAIPGVKVYAQWYEGENTQHSSPVYYTESDENGNFTLKMAPYVDANGVTREFRADASVGIPGGGDRSRDENREKIRVWTELPEDLTDKYRLVHQPAASIFPGIGANTTPTTQGDGPWGGNKISGMSIQYVQKDKLPQHLPENQWVESTGTGGNGGTYAGQAFWNLDVLQGGKTHNDVNSFDSKDIPAAGLKVVGSYLTDEAVTKIEEYGKNNFAGKTLRGSDWTPADEQGLQKWINEQVVAEPEAWIAETVTTTTGVDGRFQLRWKGIYGNNHTGTGGGINPSKEKLHTLAGSHDEGSWENGNLGSKHVNMFWSYVSILGKDGRPLPDNVGVLYPWSLGQWAGPGFGADLGSGNYAQLFGGQGSLIGVTNDSYTGWNIALVPQALKFDVVDKNTSDNWATIGDTVQTDTSGLPLAENVKYYVEWFDKDGNSVKKCAPVPADAATRIPSCALPVPADAQTGDTFTARLKATTGEPADGDLVLAMDAFAVTRAYVDYDEVEAKQGVEATSAPEFDNPATADAVEAKPENAVFELGALPEGVTADQVKVDPATGVVTFTSTAEQEGKSFAFPVVMRDEDLQVPVFDENGDPVLDGEGNPVTQARVVARGEASFKVAVLMDAETYDPKGQDQPVKVGETPDPEKNIENVGDLPEGTTYEYKETPDTKTPGEKKVTVVVTYPDGSTDEVPATVTVKENPTQAELNDPKGQDQSVKVGETPDPEKNIENVGDLPEGTTYEYKETPDTKTPGEKKVTVVVTYPDGSTDEVPATVTVSETPKPEAKDAEKYDPKGQDQPVKVGETPDPKKNIENVGDLPDGTKFEYEGGTPDTSKPGEYDVTVVVTYPDGSTDKVDTKLIVGTDAERFVPKYDEVTGVPVDGEKNTNDPFGKTAPVQDVVATPTKDSDADKWTFTPQDNGVIKAEAPSMKDVEGKIEAKLPEIKSHEAGKRWAEFVKDFTPFARPSVEVGFTYNDGSENKATAGFDLVGKDGKSLLDPKGDFDGDGVTNEDEIKGGSNPANGSETPDTTAPSINEIKPGAKEISGKGDHPGEEIFVTIPGVKDPIKVTTDKDGNWKVEVPAGVDLKTGDTITATDAAGNKTEAKVSIDTGKCVASAVGFGLPLIALLPLGLASQIQIPVLSDVAGQVEAQLKTVNTRIQQQAGIFNPEMARQVEQINAQLRTFGADLGMVAAGIVLIAAGILAGTIINDNCNPNGPKSSVKDLELKGSSGKTTKLSSKEDNNVSTSTPTAPETDTPKA